MNELGAVAAYIESLVFDERIVDARALFAEHEARLAASRPLAPHVVALRGYLAFHAGDLEAAKTLLAPVAKLARPLGARASFYLSAIAYRTGDEAETKRRLGDAIRHGGRTFIAAWARDQWADRFPLELPPEPRRPRSLRSLALLGVGLVALMLFAVVTARNLKADIAKMREARAAAVKMRRAESEIRAGKKEAAEIFFVGGAGWADQSVFLSEVHAARIAFERRYDDDGHSAVLANDPAADDDEPIFTNANLRSLLGTVARKMNREDDVLYLYLTSHGSQDGLALKTPDGTRATLEPRVLRTMLDDTGIRWRVIVVQGCESGVFLDALASENTLVATAASPDRPSYGCADGNSYTDFGRSFIVDRFPTSGTFIDALEGAAADMRKWDEHEHRLASEPSVRVGEAIRPKLGALGR